MAEQTVWTNSGGIKSHKGARAGDRFATNEEVSKKKFEDAFDSAQGASGIGGATKRTSPEYKAKKAAAFKLRDTAMKKPPLPKGELMTDIVRKK